MNKKINARHFRDELPSVGISFDDPSLAVQSSKQECDINYIVNRYLRTGELPGLRQGVYADISEMSGLQDALHMVSEAEASFMALPADVRKFFDNDPVKLVEFAANPANTEKAIELGLATRPPKAEASVSKQPDASGQTKPST